MKEYLLYIIFYVTANAALILLVSLTSAWDWATVILFFIASLYVAVASNRLSKWFVIDEKKGKK